jgi:hypothetical protein
MLADNEVHRSLMIATSSVQSLLYKSSVKTQRKYGGAPHV